MTKAKVNEYWVSGFTAETQVLMADGTSKPINKIKEGEYVTSFDPDTMEHKIGRVSNTWSEIMNDVIEVSYRDSSMIVASNQLFFTNNGEFKTAPDASAFRTLDGDELSFTVKKVSGKVKMFDITVEDSHAFVANDIMVHNKGKAKKVVVPDPVVTAGKVNRPLTISVNGNAVVVNPPADSVATVAVSYQGGATTGYNSVPGVAHGLNAPIAINASPRPDYGLPSYNNILSAQTQRTQVCNAMSSAQENVSNAVKVSWRNGLDAVRVYVDEAKKNDVNDAWNTNYTVAPRSFYYNDVIREINDLKKFVNKAKNLTAGDRQFIDGTCAEMANNLSTLEQRLRPSNGVTPAN